MIGKFKSTIKLRVDTKVGATTTSAYHYGSAEGDYDSSNLVEYEYIFSTFTTLNHKFKFKVSSITLDTNATHCINASYSTNFGIYLSSSFSNITESKTFSFDNSTLYFLNQQSDPLISTTNDGTKENKIYYISTETRICCGECGKNNNEVVNETSLPLLTLNLSTSKQTIKCNEISSTSLLVSYPKLTCTIYNEGNTTFTNLSAILTDGTTLDPLTSDTILPGETLTVTKQYAKGEIDKTTEFTVIVSGTVNGIVKTYTSNTITIDVLSCVPELTVRKNSDKSILHLEDETAQYSIEIENTGNVDLYNITLKDNGVDFSSYLISASSDDDHFKWAPGGQFKPVEGITKQEPLRPGDLISIVYEKEYTDLTCKEIKCKYKEDTYKINSAVVTALYTEGSTEKTITASATYSLDVMIPLIDIDYSVAKTYANNKITLTYTLEVENTGCVDLEDITFTDTVTNSTTYTDCLNTDVNSIETSVNENYLELSITKKVYNYATDLEVSSISAGTKIYYIYNITNASTSTVSAQIDSIVDDTLDLSSIVVPITIASGETYPISTKSFATIIPANTIRNRVDITGVGLDGTTEIDELAFSLYATCELPVKINKFNLSTTLNIDSLPIGETETKTFTRVFDRCSYEGTIDSTLTLTGGGFAINIPNIFQTPYGWSSNEEIEIWFDLEDISDTYTTSEELTIPTGTWASSTLFQSIEKVWKKKDDLEAMFPTSDQWVRAQVMDYLTEVPLERVWNSSGTIDNRVLKLPEEYSIGDSNFNKVIDPDDVIIYAKQCDCGCSHCSISYSECDCDVILKVRCINGCKITLCEDAPDYNKYTIYANFWNLNIGTLGDKKLETKTNTSAYNYLGQISAYVAAWMLMDHVKVEAQNMDGVLAMIKESTNAKLFYSRMQFLVEGLHIPSGTAAICCRTPIDFNDF